MGQSVLSIFDQPSGGYNSHHKFRIRFGSELLAPGNIVNFTAGQIDFQNIASIGFICRFRALKERQADINSISKEYAGKALGDNAGNARGLYCQGSVLPRGTTAKISGREYDVSRLNLGYEFSVYVLHTVLCHLARLRKTKIACRDNNIGIHIGAKSVNLSL